MKIMDMIGIILIVLGVSLTIFVYLAARPIADVQSVTVHEIAPHGAGGI